jgi:thymidylate synthase (FAD)
MVELLGYFGDDLMVVNAARVSFNKYKKILDYSDERLIRFLIKRKHTSPLRHPQLQFRISCPVYVERQLFKHQVGMSANSISARYVDFSDSYTSIKTWRKQSTSSKQGSEGEVDDQKTCRELENNVINLCRNTYNKLLELGVSKEQARTILPLNLNTTFIWTGSLLAYLHLFNLRIKSDAQAETREVAEAMLDSVINLKDRPFSKVITAWQELKNV